MIVSAEKTTGTRDSLSSVATSNEYDESSGYSTPATSGLTTPALAKSEAKPSTRRGRRPTALIDDDDEESTTPGVSAVARAAALRNSQYALNSSSKRKRNIISDDEDADEDDSPDAQLARTLQEQENAAADSMMVGDSGPAPRRTPRKARKILPKSDFLSDFEDSDIEETSYYPKHSSKKLKVELGSKGSNNVSFTSKRKQSMVIDTDDSDEFIEIGNSEDDEPIMSMSTPRSRMKRIIQEQSNAFMAQKSSSGRVKMPPPPARGRPSAFSAKSFSKPAPALNREDTKVSTTSSALTDLTESEFDSGLVSYSDSDEGSDSSGAVISAAPTAAPPRSRIRNSRAVRQTLNLLEARGSRRTKAERARLELHHPELHTMWKDLENLPKIGSVKIEQPRNINRELKPFQLEGVAWMKAMEETEWGGGLLGDEMGMGKTIQAVSLIMSDWPAKQPSLVLIPPVALMQWQQEIKDYTDGTLKTFVFHGTNAQTKGVTVKELMKYNVILMSYNSLESMYRKQEKGFKRKDRLHKEKSVIHQIHFHRVILDEAHNIKVRDLTYLH